MKKLICLTMALVMLLTASGAALASMDSAVTTISATEWETNFQQLLDYAIEMDLPLTYDPVFSVAEYSHPDGRTRYEHTLELASNMLVIYVEFGDDVFNSAQLAIRLDHGEMPVQMAQLAIFFTIKAGDMDTTWEESNALLAEICPTFDKVFNGEESLDGIRTATLRGVAYGMNSTDEGQFLRLYTNMNLTPKGE